MAYGNLQLTRNIVQPKEKKKFIVLITCQMISTSFFRLLELMSESQSQMHWISPLELIQMHIYLCFAITISNDLFGNSAQNSKLEQFRHNEQSENLYAAPADGLMELHEVLQTMPSSLCCVHKLEIQFAS